MIMIDNSVPEIIFAQIRDVRDGEQNLEFMRVPRPWHKAPLKSFYL